MNRLYAPFLILTLISSFQLSAQIASTNERVVFALPITPPELDGDLSDWPADALAHPITKRVWGSNPDDADDFEASFRVGYDLETNSLYVGVEVRDDDYLTLEDGEWHNQDVYSFYINEQYHLRGSGVARFSMGTNFKSTNDPSEGWDPELHKLIRWDKIDYKVKREEGATTYEFRYQLDAPIRLNRIIGMGHLVNDEDAERSSQFGWQSRGGKEDTPQPGRIGMLVFAEPGQAITEVNGQVVWNDPEIPTRVEGVRIRSTTDPDFWMHLPVSRQDGSFQVSLPEGGYRLHPGKIAFFNGFTYYKADTSNTLSFEAKGEKTVLKPYALLPVPKPEFSNTHSALLELKDRDKKVIDETIAQYMDYYEIEGVAFAALKDGAIAYQKEYGVENAYTGEPIQPTTLFEVASITKPFFAFAALRLFEKGVIDLDKPLHEYLPYEAIADQPYSKLLTARLVLSHQTGLPNWPRRGKLEFQFEPGTGFSYSGSAYQYLGRVLEHITGKDINTILMEEVAEPLEIKHLYFKEHPYAFEHKAHGHFNGYPGIIDLPENPWIAGSLITNVEGVAQFAFALHQRKGLKKETFDLMLKPQVDVPENYQENNWGYEEYVGISLFVEQAEHGLVLRHSGNNGDFKAVFRYYDGLDMGYVLLANGNTGHFILDAVEKVLLDPGKM